MAKRKRLTPARLDAATPAPEAKTLFPTRPPIADVAHDAAATAALSEVTAVLDSARNEGRLIQHIALDLIDADYLVRDRIAADPDEMAVLMTSLRARGQQTAIEVTAIENGRYGLISGWRRLTALRILQDDDPAIDTVLAVVRDASDAADIYVAMVEENEIRVGLSHYERARIVVRAVDLGVYPSDKAGLTALFGSVPRAKRSKIGSFMRIVRSLDDDLRFPTGLSERSGLALAQVLDANTINRLRKALTQKPPKDAAAESAIIASVLAPPRAPKPDGIALTDGLSYRPVSGGRMVLEGAALSDSDFVAKIISTLKTLE